MSEIYIEHGHIVMYYPIVFDKNLKREKLQNSLRKSNVVWNEMHKMSLLKSLDFNKEDLFESDEFKEINEQIAKDGLYLNVLDNEILRKDKSIKELEIDPDDIEIIIMSTPEKTSISISHQEITNMEDRRERAIDHLNEERKLYGDYYLDSLDRFLLVPCKIKLNNGKMVWLNAILYTFTNNFGILKLELPISDVGKEQLDESKLDDYIFDVTNNHFKKEFSSAKTFNEISLQYVKLVEQSIHSKIKPFYSASLHHIVFSKFKNMPGNLNKISNALKKDIYKIIMAPIIEEEGYSILEDANNHFRDYSLKYKGAISVFKTLGGIISFIDENTYNIIEENCRILEYQDPDIEAIKNIEYSLLYNSEFAIIISIMTKLNKLNNYQEKINIDTKKEDIIKTMETYYANEIFISDLQEECYGSVSEQIEEYKNMLPLYFKNNLFETKINSINNILDQKLELETEKKQRVIEFAGLFISVVFGLPAIVETLAIVRKIFSNVENPYPSISVNHAGFIIWLVVNLLLLFKLFLAEKD